MDQSARFEAGLETRRAVLGSDYVDRALANADEFTQPFQEFVTTQAWNDIWNRPGLDRRTRSIVNLATLTALGRSQELATHVRGALTNGVTPEEIREVFFQLAGYAGFPAAVEAFRAAQPIVAEWRSKHPTP
ncbi:MAG TPA: carboxymuconolactone decarboxylase family protein [Dehalococcoidia bacterium]|nr:carboxymuconolactone decarboxylase family protein [Dehalococcoidia bacterium]